MALLAGLILYFVENTSDLKVTYLSKLGCLVDRHLHLRRRAFRRTNETPDFTQGHGQCGQVEGAAGVYVGEDLDCSVYEVAV